MAAPTPVTWPDPKDSPPLPKAAAEQHTIEKWEVKLHNRARLVHPGVFWWHGYRKVGTKFGSYCYVCDLMIATWDRKYPITSKAKDAIHKHKWLHNKHL